MNSLDWSFVGKPIPRLESRAKVTGQAEYVADMDIPGCLTGRVLRSPHPHARIRKVDVTRAAALPGVKAVVTAADTPRNLWGPFIKDQPVLADGVVRYVGEEVAAVAAIDADTAEDALSQIQVEYEPLPACLTIDEALADGAPLVHTGRLDNVANVRSIEHGDVDQALRGAAVVVENEFDWPHQFHGYLEPIGSLAVPHLATSTISLYMNSWSPFMSRDEIAPAIGVHARDLRIIQPIVGGSFGGKVCDDNNAPICAVLARKARLPVRLVHTRRDEFLASRPRERGRMFARLGLAADGTIVAKDSVVWHDNGAYTGKSPAVLGVTMKRADYNYRQRNVRSRGQLVYTHTIPSGSMRGFGNPEGVFVMESLLDMGAMALGLDPLELRLRNASQVGDTSVHGTVFHSCGLPAALSEIRKVSNWDGRRQELRQAEDETGIQRGIGLGVACHVAGKRHFGNWDGATAVVQVDVDGGVRLITGIGDTGTGTDTVLAQMLSDALGSDIEDVQVSQADTAVGPYNHGTHASRTTYIAGNAVAAAGAQVRQQLAESAARVLGVDETELVFSKSCISAPHKPGSQITFAEAAQAALYRRDGGPVIGLGTWDPPTEITDANDYGNESGAYSFAVQAAEVEVNSRTGRVRVVRVWTALDCGTVVNPLLAGGQVSGGLQNGLGLALTEDAPQASGSSIFRNFDEYHMPNVTMMPEQVTVWVGDPDPTHRFGAKGLGELTIVPIAAAIANAVAHATGARLTTLPMTPERVLNALTTRGNGDGHDGS